MNFLEGEPKDQLESGDQKKVVVSGDTPTSLRFLDRPSFRGVFPQEGLRRNIPYTLKWDNGSKVTGVVETNEPDEEISSWLGEGPEAA